MHLGKSFYNRILNIFIILCIIIGIYIVVFTDINYICPFKKIFGINCVACKLTRSAKAFLGCETFLGYNVLFLPLSIFLLISVIWICKDILRGEKTYIKSMEKILEKRYKEILIGIIIFMFINNIFD